MPLDSGLHQSAGGEFVEIVPGDKLSNPQGCFVDIPEKGARFTLHREADDRVLWMRGYMGFGLFWAWKRGIDVRFERVVEEIGHEAEGELSDYVDDLCIGVACGAHGFEICCPDVATGFA